VALAEYLRTFWPLGLFVAAYTIVCMKAAGF
jgi:hypothetical protein